MKLVAPVFALWLAGMPAFAATLDWKNGETMEGEMVEASGTTVTWKSPIFDQPAILAWSAVHKIDATPGSATISGSDPFIFCMRDGSMIYGNLVTVTGSSVAIDSTRCGDLTLKRSEVLSARRISGGQLLLAGPRGVTGWQQTDNPAVQSNRGIQFGMNFPQSAAPGNLPAITGGPGGELKIPYWNRSAKAEISLPETGDAEFVLRASGQPAFSISFGSQGGAAVRIETWDDEIVACAGQDFGPVRKIGDGEHEIGLRVCWDRPRHRVTVYSRTGDVLLDWQPNDTAWSGTPGIVLHNKGRDLSLEFLRIRTWNGTPPPKVDLGKARIELADGRPVAGEALSGSNGSIDLIGVATTAHVDSDDGLSGSDGLIDLTGTAGQTPQNFASRDVDAIVFSPEMPTTAHPEAVLSFSDGTYLAGAITGVTGSAVTMTTQFSGQPLTARLDGLRRLAMNAEALPGSPPPPPLDKLDCLTAQNARYHGVFTTAGDAVPRWLPFGGVAPVALAKTLPWQIERYVSAAPPVAAPAALFYMRSGDVLPGALHGLDHDDVELDSPNATVASLPSAQLRAIQFGPFASGNLHGFNGPGWHIVKGTASGVKRSGDSLELQPGNSIGHPAAMRSREVKFTVDASGGFFTTRFRMFCAGTDPGKSTNLLVAVGMNNGIVCGEEGPENQIQDQSAQGSVSGPVQVRLVIHEEDVELYLNGALMADLAAPSASRAGSGLVIEPAGLWGNQVNPIRLTDFTTESLPGSPPLPDVPPDAKSQALTVPRFEHDDPPVHAVLAPNGDLLRGEVTGITRDSLAFRSGMDEVVLPRERVKAVVWLGKPREAQAPGKRALVLQSLAQPTGSRGMMFGGADLFTVINFLKNSAPELKFKINGDVGRGNYTFQIGQEPIAVTLDKVCRHYGLAYEVDDQGVIVIGPAERSASDLVEKTYWLKPGSFRAGEPVQKTLSAKGIAFPPGATATWDADAGELHIRNTAEMAPRLEQLLTADFEGPQKSPTHWFQLTNGGRLELAVDRFGKDTVTGFNPRYGHCTVPVSDLAIISSHPIEPTPVMRSLKDWQLVYAPEPVLPEGTGDSSALIGKMATDFTLPLLAGGQFDLSRERGKVVVLDFWATWCGPCVHSLPDLIQAMSAFSPNGVTFVAVDQGEPAAQVKQFLETRGWNLRVALDDEQHVGSLYGASAIPQTVIIGPDGKIAWVNTGYSPEGGAEAAKAVNRLLGKSSAPGVR